MAASKEDIRRWLNHGKESGATHMIVVCDTYDHENYPVYVMPDENVRERSKEFDGRNMQTIMEVYSYKHDLEKQNGRISGFSLGLTNVV